MLCYEDPFTDDQVKINACVEDTDKDRMQKWLQFAYGPPYMRSTVEKKSNKTINQSVHDFLNVFASSQEFIASLKEMFNTNEIQEHQLSLGISCLLRVQDLFYHVMAHENDGQRVGQQKTEHTPSSEAKNSVR